MARGCSCKRTITNDGIEDKRINWMVYTDDGGLTIAGTGASVAWRFVEGAANAANDDYSK